MKQRKGLNVIEKTLTNLNMNGVYTKQAQLYDTLIYDQCENEIRLNSGGFKTKHTKNCINDLLSFGYDLFQKDYIWYVRTPDETLEFFDGMIIKV